MVYSFSVVVIRANIALIRLFVASILVFLTVCASDFSPDFDDADWLVLVLRSPLLHISR